MFQQVRIHRVRRGPDAQPIRRNKCSDEHFVHKDFSVLVPGHDQPVQIPAGAEVWYWQDPCGPTNLEQSVACVRWDERNKQLTLRGNGNVDFVDHAMIRATPVSLGRRASAIGEN